MKKTILLSTLFVSTAFAIENGNPESREMYPQFATSGSCASTIIGGKWALTSAQCDQEITGSNFIVTVNDSISVERSVRHPQSDTDEFDMALWSLKRPPQLNKISLLSLKQVEAGERIKIYGASLDGLISIVQEALAVRDDFPQRLDLKNVGKGTTSPFDKGAANINANGELVAVYSDKLDSGIGTMNSRINQAVTKEWILETIDAWHYPTLVNTHNGTATITIQSLHVNSASDEAWTSGDVSINSELSTCNKGPVESFKTCSYAVTSSGDEGILHLSGTEQILINKPEEIPPVAKNGSGGGGGSTGIISLLGLLGMALLRRNRNLKSKH